MFGLRIAALACSAIFIVTAAHAEADKSPLSPSLTPSETQDARPHIAAAAVTAAERATSETAFAPAARQADTPAEPSSEPVKGKVPAAAETQNSAPPAAPAKELEAAKPAPPPEPTLTAKIDLSRQTMVVAEDGDVKYTWPISSGAEEFPSPRGTYHPQWLAKMWYSKKYDNAPMPNAVFITGGVAIHATQHVSSLGRPASHGCIRLAPGNAKTFYSLVQKHGLKLTRVSIYGTPKWHAPAIAARDRNDDQPRRRVVQRDDEQNWYPPARKYRPNFDDQRYAQQRRYRQVPSYNSNYQAAPRYYYRPSTGERFVYVQRPPRRYYYNNYGYGYGGGW